MGRCYGYTKNLNRCQIDGYPFFCKEHSKQQIVLLFIIFGLFGTFTSIQSACFNTESIKP